ncbi:MAG: hypothetical protein IPM81_19290 [Saprospirales bacterium]|nr:hypothetical protein [Saprospirales bacterium]
MHRSACNGYFFTTKAPTKAGQFFKKPPKILKEKGKLVQDFVEKSVKDF